ncbi:MAG: hypothetical protein QOH26_1720, partial [Actinomycetota bacterium]|nr:hypothetical protein [Actinomycetota bacterium]
MKQRRYIAALGGLLLLLPTGASAQSTGSGEAADVGMTVVAPPSTPLVGDAFQLVYTVTNSGPSDAADVYFSDYLSGELELESVSSSDNSDTCGPDQPAPEAYPPSTDPKSGGGGSVGSPGYYGGSGGISCTLG